jgi:hypothetical protein
MNLNAQVKNINGKKLAWHQLALFFGEKSPYGLIKALRHYSREGFFRFEITLMTEYFDEQRARQEVPLHTDVLNPIDPFGAMRNASHPLSFNDGTTLSESQIDEVTRMLPRDMIDQYLRFTLNIIDQAMLVKLVSKLTGENAVEEDAFYRPVVYHGLAIEGSVISFRKKPFKMGLHHREAMRILIEKKGGVCTYDDFKDDDAGIFTKTLSEYSNINHTIRGLIYDLRTELTLATGKQLIENSDNGGWYLDIEP